MTQNVRDDMRNTHAFCALFFPAVEGPKWRTLFDWLIFRPICHEFYHQCSYFRSTYFIVVKNRGKLTVRCPIRDSIFTVANLQTISLLLSIGEQQKREGKLGKMPFRKC